MFNEFIGLTKIQGKLSSESTMKSMKYQNSGFEQTLYLIFNLRFNPLLSPFVID